MIRLLVSDPTAELWWKAENVVMTLPEILDDDGEVVATETQTEQEKADKVRRGRGGECGTNKLAAAHPMLPTARPSPKAGEADPLDLFTKLTSTPPLGIVTLRSPPRPSQPKRHRNPPPFVVSNGDNGYNYEVRMGGGHIV